MPPKEGKQLQLTAFGKLIPTGTAGEHGYDFAAPEGSPQHTAKDYAPRPSAAEAKVTSGSCFARLALRDGIEGILTPIWRLQHDPVRHLLVTRKPFVGIASDLPLEKGKPKRVLWATPPASGAGAAVPGA